MLTAYESQGCKMSLKVEFLHSHIDHFLKTQEYIGTSKVKDISRMSTDDTTEDLQSTDELITVECSGRKKQDKKQKEMKEKSLEEHQREEENVSQTKKVIIQC